MQPKRDITVMGILNLTGDSFYSGSRFLRPDGTPDIPSVLQRAGEMLSHGADILDLGACSSRPGSVPVGAQTEWERLSPALEPLREHFPAARFSIDTCWSEVIRRCVDRIGPVMVNDISAGTADPRMLGTAVSLGLPYIAMHADRETPSPVTETVLAFFSDFAVRARAAGLDDWILDPGFGFGKTVRQNYALLADLGRLQVFGRPVLVGISRKSMVYKPLGITPAEALPATQTLHMAALERGASLLRVHDPLEARQTVTLWRQLTNNSL